MEDSNKQSSQSGLIAAEKFIQEHTLAKEMGTVALKTSKGLGTTYKRQLEFAIREKCVIENPNDPSTYRALGFLVFNIGSQLEFDLNENWIGTLEDYPDIYVPVVSDTIYAPKNVILRMIDKYREEISQFENSHKADFSDLCDDFIEEELRKLGVPS